MVTIKKKAYAAPRHEEQEIETLVHKGSDLLARYQKQAAIAAVAAVAVLVLYIAYSLVRSSQEQSAAPLLAAAYDLYRPAEGAAGDYNRALERFREVQKKYPSTESGAAAQYYAGNCLMALGRLDEALKEYQSFASNYSGQKVLLGFVEQRMGYLYAALGRKDDARKAFEQAESHVGPGASTVELARLYEQAGNGPEAQKKYKEVQDKLAGTGWSTDAMGKVQRIVPQPAPAAPAAK
jgi:tetratricopeptide (TPR) repeat protein